MGCGRTQHQPVGAHRLEELGDPHVPGDRFVLFAGGPETGAAVKRGQSDPGVGKLGPQVILAPGELVDHARENLRSAVAEFGDFL